MIKNLRFATELAT